VLVKNEMFADAVPVVVGAKVKVNGILCPDAIVNGRLSPPSVNAALLELTEETVTLPPDAVTLPLWLWLLPIVTEPKLIEPGVTPNVPLEVAPVPDSAIVIFGSEAFELSERVALAVPATVGEKTTDRLTLLPAARVYGKVKPPTVKTEPLAIADEILRLDPPEFVNVSACV
jgi:hypothetical protein